MNLFDRITLLATGLVAIYLLWRFFTRYRDSGERQYLYYMAGFGVLLVAGLLLIAFTYAALESPLVIIVAVLIPAGISAGLITHFLPHYEKPYLVFVVVGLVAVAVTRFTGPAGLATVTLVIVHSICGVVILGLPLWMVRQGKAPQGALWVAVGGLLIDLGGVALAFLKAGSQLLFFSQDVVFAILAPLLLLMVASFAFGFSRLLAHT